MKITFAEIINTEKYFNDVAIGQVFVPKYGEWEDHFLLDLGEYFIDLNDDTVHIDDELGDLEDSGIEVDIYDIEIVLREEIQIKKGI